MFLFSKTIVPKLLIAINLKTPNFPKQKNLFFGSTSVPLAQGEGN